jgi:Zn-dependent protease with chaperone function
MVRLVWDGHYLDGQTADKIPATIELAHDSLKIHAAGGVCLEWPYREIRQTQGFYGSEPVRLERGGGTPEALIIPDPDFLSSLHELSPGHARHVFNPAHRPLRRRLTLYAALGTVIVGLGVYFWLIPFAAELFAPCVPVQWETRLGESMLQSLAPEERRCTGPELDQALGGIVAVITAGDPGPYSFRVHVVNYPMVNALALPGGNIVVFRGLLEATGSPGELAGVIAHEIQHITRRHTTKRIIRDSSTGLLISAATGDITGVSMFGAKAAHTLARLRYSRQDEEEADREGMRMIISAGIDPQGMVRFFETLEEQSPGSGTLLEYVATHPEIGRRVMDLKRFASLAGEPAGGYAALPGKEDWERIKKSCQVE